MTVNEAAERLHGCKRDHGDELESTYSLSDPHPRAEWLYCRQCNTHWQPRYQVLEQIAAERRATVERIRERLIGDEADADREIHANDYYFDYITDGEIARILDEEAVR